mmetsp:Transcript_29343/g.60150  ORF Transcript_29343/g.60150 Transcript_29343/m.60150 type:complete len:188 (+) Transcript_29343:285-848(+)
MSLQLQIQISPFIRHAPVEAAATAHDSELSRALGLEVFVAFFLSLRVLVHSHVTLSGACVCCAFVRIIPSYFDWVDLPSRRSGFGFSPGVDLVVLAGNPTRQGAFLGAFPFQRFPTVQAIVDRLSVKLIDGDTGAELLRTVRVEDLRVNPVYARGCFVATVVECDVLTGRFIEPPFSNPDLWRRFRR